MSLAEGQPDEARVRVVKNKIWTRSADLQTIDDQTSIPWWKNARNDKDDSGLCHFCDTTCARHRALKKHYTDMHTQKGPAPAPHTRGAAARRLHPPSNPSAPGTSLGDPVAPYPQSESSIAQAVANHAHSTTDAIANEDQVEWDFTVPAFLKHSGLAVLGRWKAILCTECKLCVPAENALGHLKDKHQFTTLKKDEFSNFVQRHGLNGKPSDIVAEVKASRCFQECPWLDQLEGWWCEQCGYATESETRSAEHGRLAGHFTQDEIVVNGENHQRRRRVIRGHVQTLFSTNLGGTIPSIPCTGQAAPDSASKVFRQLLELQKDIFNPPILSLDDPRSLHPFITTSGFARWIEEGGDGKMNWNDVDMLKRRFKMSDAILGGRLLLHCRKMMEISFSLCVPETYMARCIVNSPNTTIETTPFGELTSEDARKRYCSHWAEFIAYIINSRDVAEATRRFTLSSTQQEQLGYYLELLEDPKSGLETEDDDSLLLDAVEALTLLSARLICHEMVSSSNHPLITYTILHSIKPGLIISNPTHISPFLATLEYFCRVTVMGTSYLATAAEPDTSLYQAVKTSWVWLKEGENTPFAWLRQMLHLTARFVYGNNTMPRFIWGLDDGKSYTFDGCRVQVSEYTSMIRSAVHETVDGFFDLCDTYGLPHHLLFTSFDDVDDDLAVRAVNYNFTRHPPNVKLQRRAEECLDTVIDSGKFCHTVPSKVVQGKFGQGGLVWHPSAIREAFGKSEAFLRCLAAAIYLSSGQPPRGTELMATLITNINTRVRNLFCSNNAIVLSHFLNKTTFHLKSDKAIVREVCPALSLVLLNYVAFLRPIEAKMAAHIGTPATEVEWMQRRLFQIGSRHLNTEVLSMKLKSLWKMHVTRYGDTFEGWGTAETRQNAIYVGRRCVKVEWDKDGEALYDLQAGHGSIVARSSYGVEGNRLGGNMSPRLMGLFCDLSRGHHGSYETDKIPFRHSRAVHQSMELALPHPQPSPLEATVSSSSVDPIPSSVQQAPPIPLPAPCTSTSNATAYPSQENGSPSVPPSQETLVGSLPPPTSLPVALDERGLATQIAPALAEAVLKALGGLTSQGDTLAHMRSSAKSLSAVTSPEVFASMKEVLGEDGRFRSVEQAAATQAAWDRSNHLLAVLPTGAGKTLVAEVTTNLERQKKMVNVILVPLSALAKDLKARFEKRRVIAQLWEGKDTPFSQVLIAVFEQAGKDDFMNYLKALVENGTLGRIIVDECHYPVFSASDGFRNGMKSLSTLVTLRVPLVLLTATVPISSTTELLDFYGVPQAKVIRASTNRPNIQYVVKPIVEDEATKKNSRAVRAFQAIKQAIKEHKPKEQCKVIVYLQDKQLLDDIWKLAMLDPEIILPWNRYHASMREDDKEQSLGDWIDVMLATPALGLGIDRGDCRLVLHYGPPHSMVEYAQESGRAGRDGSPSCAVLLWNRIPQWADRVVSSYLTTSLCRRRVIFGYLDGDGPDCLSLSEDNLLCDNCATATANASQAQQKSLAPPNNIGPLVTQRPPRAPRKRAYPTIPGFLQPLSEEEDDAEPTDLEMVIKMAKVLHGGCSKCWLAGRNLKGHKKIEWNCVRRGVYRYSEEEMRRYSAWKKSWPQVQTGQFKDWACGLCWLPDEGYHDPLKDITEYRCYYGDGLGPLAWSVFHDTATLRAYKIDHPEATTHTLTDWGAWLSGAGPLGAPRFHDLVLWADKKMELTYGMESLWNRPF